MDDVDETPPGLIERLADLETRIADLRAHYRNMISVTACKARQKAHDLEEQPHGKHLRRPA